MRKYIAISSNRQRTLRSIVISEGAFMTNYALINKEVIPFICDRKRVSTDYLVVKTGCKLERIRKWLDVKDPALPTINQAKKIAKALNIPFAGLYMNKDDIKISSIPKITNFRSLNGDVQIDDSSLNIAICGILNERDYVLSAIQEFEMQLPTLSLPTCDGAVESFARSIREHFELDISRQFKCTSARQFYLLLRKHVEDKGIFVQCFVGVPVETARAFAIYKDHMPIIGLNDLDRSPAKSFSLIHELVHLINRESSLCNDMYNSMEVHKEEIFCNAVAGEVLVPKYELNNLLKHESDSNIDLYMIRWLADKFSVSREVIIRRLLDLNHITKAEYSAFSETFVSELESNREEQKTLREMGLSKGIPRNISREAIDRFSTTTCYALLYGYAENFYSKRDIALHLGIAQKHVDSFLKEVSGWSS